MTVWRRRKPAAGEERPQATIWAELGVRIEDTPADSRAYRKTTKAKQFLQQAKQATGGERVDLVRSRAGALRRTGAKLTCRFAAWNVR